MEANVVLTDSTMLGVGKSDENSLVHCCFVVTPSLKEVQVTTITWYNYPLHC